MKWYHVECLNLSNEIYEALANTSVEWICCNCGLPNFSSSLFEEAIPESINGYESLSSSTSNEALSGLLTQEHGSVPISSSTPKAQHGKPKGNNPGRQIPLKRNVKILIMNFQSIVNKKEDFANLINATDPDVIIGSETWLNKDIMNGEIFQNETYEVSRKDRNDGHGGVLIAIKRSLNSQSIEVKTESEQVWVKITRQRKCPIIIGSLYRPPKSGLDYMENMRRCADSVIKKHKNSILWIGGDLNLPDIEWPSCSISGNQYLKSINEEFLSFLEENSLQQMVTTATREENILDLFITKRPSLLNRCEVIPGISDHETVFVNINIEPHRTKPAKRKIYIWSKANTNEIQSQLERFCQQF